MHSGIIPIAIGSVLIASVSYIVYVQSQPRQMPMGETPARIAETPSDVVDGSATSTGQVATTTGAAAPAEL